MVKKNEAGLAGEILKNKREELGLEIREVAESLKICEEYLAAIENDAIEKLPVSVYTMGYIRCYAAFVGVDADPIILFYRERLSQPQPSTLIPIAFSRKKGPRIGYLIAVLGVVIIAFLFLPRRPGGRNVELPTMAPAAGKVSEGSQAGSALAETDAVQRGGAAGAVAAGLHSLSVTADDTTWISLTLENGRREEILLRPGQSQKWSFSGKASLKVGNAGGIDVRLDGKDLGKPGSSGQVKNLTLPAEEAGR